MSISGGDRNVTPSGQLNHLVKNRGLATLVFGQVGIARAHGKAVLFPKGRPQEDTDREVEIASHLSDNHGLLEILFTKNGHMGLGQQE